MGNCCFKSQPGEPNRPVSTVHITAEGNRLNVANEIDKTKITSSKSSSGSPSARKSKRYKQPRRRKQNGLKSSQASPTPNTQILSEAKHKEEKEKRLHREERDKRQRTQTTVRERPSKKPSNSHGDEQQLHWFGYLTMQDATNNFSKKNFLGEGGFGDVYKGHITFHTMEAAKPNEGVPVAVKRLIRSRSHGYEAWKTEVQILGSLSHPNIVRLIGCCREGQHKMIVYEYMDKGSLDCCLFRDHKKDLNWSRRIKIAIGAAKGLAYLHSNTGKRIIHRDIKASNLLIDSKYNTKISDFGLAKYGPENEDEYIITAIIGTTGYLAPEYYNSGHLTMKADVYSFGVVLLEILSGSSVDSRCSKGLKGNLVQRAKPLLSRGTEGELRRVIDAKLGRSVPMKQAHKYAELTCQCLNEDPKGRPTMDQVVKKLTQLQDGVDHPGNLPSTSRTRRRPSTLS